MTTVGGGKAFDSPVEVGNGAGTHVHCCYWEYSKALALVRYSFPRLLNPVKGTNMSTLLSTPRQVTIPPSYLDIGMGGHFEGCKGCKGLGETVRRGNQNRLPLSGGNYFAAASICAVFSNT